MPQPAQNVRVYDDAIDGKFVEMIWDDPNVGGTQPTDRVQFWSAQTGGYEVFATHDIASCRAVLKPGSYWISLRYQGYSATRVALDVPAAKAKPVPPPPVKGIGEYTERELIEYALNTTLPPGTKVGLWLGDPDSLQTVNADGSIS